MKSVTKRKTPIHFFDSHKFTFLANIREQTKLPANVKIYMYCNPLEEQLTTYLNSDWLIHFPAEVHGKTISMGLHVNEEMYLQKFDLGPFYSGFNGL